MTTKIRTKRGALRRFNALLRACRKDSSGGLMFGMDYPTIAAVFPERYQEMLHIRSIFRDLPA